MLPIFDIAAQPWPLRNFTPMRTPPQRQTIGSAGQRRMILNQGYTRAA
jgi:hypothetical protein